MRAGLMRPLLILAAALSLWAAPAYALFELTASPQKGGRDLRFDAGLSSQGAREEQLTLTAESDQAVQYRIHMTVLSPLTNEQGKTLSRDALYVFSPTNALGDLRLKLESPVELGQSIVYTSNPAGDSDQILLVFHANLPPDLQGGVYRTSVSFTMEPVVPAAGLTPRTATLEFRVESRPAFRLSVKNEKGGERLDLGRMGQNGTPPPAVLNVEIESNVGQSYRLFQELRGPLTSQTGMALSEDAVTFQAEGASSGKAASGRLSSSPALLFESDPLGGPARFRTVYQPDLPPDTAAGRFAGMLLFRVDSSSPYAAGQTVQVPVTYEIEPVFNLDIEIPDGYGLAFGPLRSGQQAQDKRVILKIRSNLHQPYQISQIVSRRMTTPEGSALSEDAFRYSVERTSTGTVEAIASRPVPPGESPLFLSDAAGTPETIICTYVLTIPTEAKAGSYGTEIKYSITTL